MRCNLCNKKNMELFLEISSSNYLRCTNCGLVCLENMPDMSKIKTVYNSDYFVKKGKGGLGADFIGEEKLYFAKFQNRIKRIERRIKTGRILDIGTSVGQFLFVARKAGWDISGVEVSEAAADMARQHYKINIDVGTLEDVDFGNDLFDVVTLWHVFEHFPDPMQSLKKIHSLLKKDGLLVIELPNIGSKKAINAGVKWSYLLPSEHLFYYTPVTISRFLEKAHFKIETIEYIAGGTGIGDWLDKKGLVGLKKFIFARLQVVNKIINIAPSIIAKIWRNKELMIVFARKK